MSDFTFFYWGGCVFWSVAGFFLGWVLGRHELRTNYLLKKEKERESGGH